MNLLGLSFILYVLKLSSSSGNYWQLSSIHVAQLTGWANLGFSDVKSSCKELLTGYTLGESFPRVIMVTALLLSIYWQLSSYRKELVTDHATVSVTQSDVFHDPVQDFFSIISQKQNKLVLNISHSTFLKVKNSEQLDLLTTQCFQIELLDNWFLSLSLCRNLF